MLSGILTESEINEAFDTDPDVFENNCFIKLYEKEPSYMRNIYPEWCCDNYPGDMCDHLPMHMARHKPDILFKNRPHVLAMLLPEYVKLFHKDWVEKYMPYLFKKEITKEYMDIFISTFSNLTCN